MYLENQKAALTAVSRTLRISASQPSAQHARLVALANIIDAYLANLTSSDQLEQGLTGWAKSGTSEDAAAYVELGGFDAYAVELLSEWRDPS